MVCACACVCEVGGGGAEEVGTGQMLSGRVSGYIYKESNIFVGFFP